MNLKKGGSKMNTATKLNLSKNQLEKLELLRTVAGSIKTDYKVEVVGATNDLRGKPNDDNKECQ